MMKRRERESVVPLRTNDEDEDDCDDEYDGTKSGCGPPPSMPISRVMEALQERKSIGSSSRVDVVEIAAGH